MADCVCPFPHLPRYSLRSEATEAIPADRRNRWVVWNCGDAHGYHRHWHSGPPRSVLDYREAADV